MLNVTAQRIVRWHPFVLSALILAGLLLQISLSETAMSQWARALVTLMALGPFCVWLWAVYNVARRASARRISSRWDWVFVIPPIVAFVAGLAGWSDQNSSASFIIALGIFVGLSRAAKTLENVDAPSGSAPVGRMLATAVLMYLAPIGVWVLRAKISRVAALTGAL